MAAVLNFTFELKWAFIVINAAAALVKQAVTYDKDVRPVC